jgi:hypothetical protein
VFDGAYEVLIEDLWPVAGRTIIIGTHHGEPIEEDDSGVIVDEHAEVTSVRRFFSIDDHPPGKVALMVADFGQFDGVKVGHRLIGRRGEPH